MPDLLDIETVLLRACHLNTHERLLVAVSGGPDSLALLHRLATLAPKHDWHLHVAHLDHGLRGAQSANEARFVAMTAAEWGLSATIDLRDVGALAHEYRVGLPAAARAARYRFLADVAHEINATAVVVGHQADDQAETVLLHLLRGSGPSGLSGMVPRLEWQGWRYTAGYTTTTGPALIRPLLYCSRSEIEDYCIEHGLNPRRDPTNESSEYSRGRIRHHLLPVLQEYNPQIVAALSRTARLASSEAAYMQTELDRQWNDLVTLETGAVHVDQTQWQAMHPALQRLAFRRAVSLLRPEHDDFSAIQLDGALEAMQRNALFVQLPQNLILHRRPQGWTITIGTAMQTPTSEPQLHTNHMAVMLGITPLPESNWQLRLEIMPHRPEYNLARWQTLLDADCIKDGLHLRQRQSGERIRPAGGIGSRKIQDLMVDMKLPRELRERWPLLADEQGLLWIPGLVIAEHVNPTPETTRFLLATLEELNAEPS